MKKYLLSMLLALLIPLGAVAQEAYAVLSGSVLTIYYDNLRSTRTGTKYVMNIESGTGSHPWYNTKRNDITKVIIDQSFSNARPKKSFSWFSYHTNLKEIEGMEFVNTSEVTTMYRMFMNCSSLASVNVSQFDTRNVTNMEYMFYGCKSLTNIDVSGFETSNVTSMLCMFRECDKLSVLDVSHFDTSNVTDMMQMFYHCRSLDYLDVSHFDTKKVTTMGSMFAHCEKMGSIDVDNFNTCTVESMNGMFQGCSSLTDLDLSTFDTGNVKSMSYMFANCSSLSFIDLSSFDTRNVTRMEWMFHSCSSLTSLDLSSFNTSKVESFDRMFPNCSKLKTIYCSEGWSTEGLSSDATNAAIFHGCNNLVGGLGTTYNASVYPTEGYIYVNVDLPYAHIDEGVSNPGYFTYKPSPLYLDQEDNTTLLEDNDGETKDVMLKFNIPSGKWITLCLPFDATTEQTQAALGDDVDIEELSTSAYDAETKLLTLNFTPCTAITAGRPYVVKVSETKNRPKFSGVTIDKTAPTTVSTTYCSMTGIYNATPLTAGDRNTLFIQNNQFYYPSTAGSLPATKCYFTLSLGASEARSIDMHFWDDEDVTSGIYEATATKTEDNDAWYTPQGIRVNRPTKGLYIHNGKKVIVNNK